MWHILKQNRVLGRPEVTTTVMPGSEVETAEEALDLARIIAEDEAADLSPYLQPRKLAENVYQYDTILGTRVTYLVQPTNWRVE